jgi:hypothetical protein
MNVIFSVGCDSRIRHRTKDRINPIFCVVSDAAVASDTENHGLCKPTFREESCSLAVLSLADLIN